MAYKLHDANRLARRCCVAELYEVANVPLAEGIPIGGVRTGRRNVSWKTSEPATLIWLEALDGGDPNREAEHRD